MVAEGIAEHLKYYLKGKETEIDLAVRNYLEDVKKAV
jgi:hypothetical protein